MKTSFANKHAPGAESQSESNAQAHGHGRAEAEQGTSVGLPFFLQQAIVGTGAAGAVQPKLIVGQPDDVYEREANHVAAQVVAGNTAAPPRPTISAATSRAARSIQRCAACSAGKPCAKCAADQGLIQRQPSSAADLDDATLSPEVLQQIGSGQPLDPTARGLMEARFGQSFADVQIHADASSAAVAEQLRAHAFTVGQHIYFGNDRYQPQTSAGQHLLAHELTHTVQQRGGGSVPQTPLRVNQRRDQGEREAQRATSRRGPVQLSRAQAGSAAAMIQRYSWDDFTSGVGNAAGAVYDVGADVVGAGADVVEAGVELAGDALEALVRQVAPELADLIDEGPFEFFKRYIEGMIGDWVPSLFSDLSPGAIIDSVVGGLSDAFAAVEGVLQGDAASCQAFADILGALRDLASSLIDNPLVQMLKELFSTISETISTVVNFVLAPAFDLLADILGGAWDAIKSIATTVWGWISTVRDLAGEAIDWVLEQLGLSGGDDEGGILAWIKEQAGEIWTTIKETFAPVIGPIQTVLATMVILSPLGGVYLALKYGPKVVEAVQWLWAHKDDPDIIRSAHEQMSGTILPQLLETVAGFRDVLQGAANWLIETLSSLAAGVLELLGGITGVPLLSMAQDFVQMLSDGVQSLINWGQSTLQSMVTTIQEVAQSIWDFVAPYKEVLSSVAMALLNPPMIPMILMGWAWTMLPSCIKIPLIDFFLDILIAAIELLPELVIFGPLWPVLKSGILGFFRRMRTKPPAVKERISDKIAKIMSGRSPAFIIGFVKGFLQGIWEGITDPFMLIWMVIEGLSYAQNYLEKLAAETFGAAPAPAAATASTSTAAPAAPTQAVSSSTSASRSAAPATTPVTASAGVVAGGGAGGAAAIDPGLSARVGEMAQELEPPVTQVTENFWSAVTEYFNSGEGMTFEGLVSKMGEAWESLRGKVEEAGGTLADKAVEFLDSDGAEGDMGSAVGWLAGTIAFEVLLDVITAGIWAAAGPIARALQKFMTKVNEVIEYVFGLFRRLGSFLVDGVKKLGKMIAEGAGGTFALVKNALGEIGQKLMAFADEIIGRLSGSAGREGVQAAEREAAERAIKEAEQKAAKEAQQKVASEAGQTAEQKAASEAQQKTAAEAEQKAAKEGEQKAASEAEQKAAEKPMAMAQARAIEAVMDEQDVPVPVLLGALEASVMPRYKWIKRFEAEPQGGSYLIYMIASKELVDKFDNKSTKPDGDGAKPEGTPADQPAKQTTGGQSTPPKRERPIPEGGISIEDRIAQGASIPPNVKLEPDLYYYDPKKSKYVRRPEPTPTFSGPVQKPISDVPTKRTRPIPEGGISVQERMAQGGSPRQVVKDDPDLYYFDTNNSQYTRRPEPTPSFSPDAAKQREIPCFPKGTLVTTATGSQPIETLRAGMEVLAFDEHSQRTQTSAVLAVHQNQAIRLVEIVIDGETVYATQRHRFWVSQIEGWVAARSLLPDMYLRTADGGLRRIQQTRVHDVPAQGTYNLTVADCHTYFVGAASLLVHNADETPRGKIYIGRNAKGEIIYVGQTDQDLLDRQVQHRADAIKEPDKYAFKQDMKIELAEGMDGLTPDQMDYHERRVYDQLEKEGHNLQNRQTTMTDVKINDLEAKYCP